MYDFAIYSLKVGGCLAVFYLFFKLLLSRDTFHRVNRFLILAAMVLSFLLPLCVITIYRELPVVPQLSDALVSALPTEVQPEPFPWKTVLVVVFLVGAGATLLRTLISVAGVVRVIGGGRYEKLADGSVLVRTAKIVTPFSWGRYIVLSDQDSLADSEAIILHEKAHSHLRHSVDLLLTDLAGCLQWFNPAMWLLRGELRAIHEYEADAAVLDSGVDAKQYQLLLIRKAVGKRWYSVANSFNHSKLKNRVTMMLCKKSSRWAGAKVLFVLPLLGLALGAFARTAYVYPDDKGKKEKVTVHVVDGENSSQDGEQTRVHVFKTDTLTYQVDAQGADTPRVMTYSIDAQGDSTGKVIVYKIDGKQVSRGDVGEMAIEGVHSVNVVKGEGDGENVIEIITTKRRGAGEAAKASIEAAKAGIEAARAALESARERIPAAEFEKAQAEIQQAQHELEQAQFDFDKAHVNAMQIDIPQLLDKGTSIGLPKTKGKIVSVNSSFSASDKLNDPLFVIDGKVQQSAESINELEATQIKSMAVLKDAEAVEKYGEQGKNGVVEIETKK